MAITLVGAAGLLGSIVLFEGLAAIFEEVVGDPEADVQLALQRLAANNQRRAFSITAAEQAGIEDIDQSFAEFNQIPQRALSEVSLAQQSGNPFPQQDNGLLDHITSRLRVPGHELERLSSPSRLGDMSSIHRRLGNSLASAPPSSGTPQGQ